MGTYRLARRSDNRVTSCCTWCGATSPVGSDASVLRWQRAHSCARAREDGSARPLEGSRSDAQTKPTHGPTLTVEGFTEALERKDAQ